MLEEGAQKTELEAEDFIVRNEETGKIGEFFYFWFLVYPSIYYMYILHIWWNHFHSSPIFFLVSASSLTPLLTFTSIFSLFRPDSQLTFGTLVGYGLHMATLLSSSSSSLLLVITQSRLLFPSIVCSHVPFDCTIIDFPLLKFDRAFYIYYVFFLCLQSIGRLGLGFSVNLTCKRQLKSWFSGYENDLSLDSMYYLVRMNVIYLLKVKANYLDV